MILIAEIIDFQRFQHPRELMAYLGLVPSEYSSGTPSDAALSPKRATRMRVACSLKAAWHYRHRPTVAGALRRRTEGQPPGVVSHAWRAQQRLHQRYRHLVGHGKRPPIAVVAVARELVGFLWAAMTRPAIAA
jgi:transposase